MRASRKATMIVRSLATAAVLVWIVPTNIAADEQAGLSVAESGVGSAVANRELQGKSDSFPEGGSVCFLTKIAGGQAGETIEQVWSREGKEVWKTSLSIGGSPWRTWSCKTMHKGSAGQWKVEARASDGKVLGGGSFTCSAAP